MPPPGSPRLPPPSGLISHGRPLRPVATILCGNPPYSTKRFLPVHVDSMLLADHQNRCFVCFCLGHSASGTTLSMRMRTSRIQPQRPSLSSRQIGLCGRSASTMPGLWMTQHPQHVLPRHLHSATTLSFQIQLVASRFLR